MQEVDGRLSEPTISRERGDVKEHHILTQVRH